MTYWAVLSVRAHSLAARGLTVPAADEILLL